MRIRFHAPLVRPNRSRTKLWPVYWFNGTNAAHVLQTSANAFNFYCMFDVHENNHPILLPGFPWILVPLFGTIWWTNGEWWHLRRMTKIAHIHRTVVATVSFLDVPLVACRSTSSPHHHHRPRCLLLAFHTVLICQHFTSIPDAKYMAQLPQIETTAARLHVGTGRRIPACSQATQCNNALNGTMLHCIFRGWFNRLSTRQKLKKL